MLPLSLLNWYFFILHKIIRPRGLGFYKTFQETTSVIFVGSFTSALFWCLRHNKAGMAALTGLRRIHYLKNRHKGVSKQNYPSEVGNSFRNIVRQ